MSRKDWMMDQKGRWRRKAKEIGELVSSTLLTFCLAWGAMSAWNKIMQALGVWK